MEEGDLEGTQEKNDVSNEGYDNCKRHSNKDLCNLPFICLTPARCHKNTSALCEHTLVSIHLEGLNVH